MVYRSAQGTDVPWDFPLTSKVPPHVPLQRKLVVDDGRALVDGVRGGLGIAQLFDLLVKDDLETGRLVQLFPGAYSSGPPLHALYKKGQSESPKVRALLTFLRTHLRRT